MTGRVYCTKNHEPGEHDVTCMPPADPGNPELRLLRAIFGLCPDHDSCTPGDHIEYRAGLPDDPPAVTADDWAITSGPDVIGYIVHDSGLGPDAPYETYSAAGDWLADYESFPAALNHWKESANEQRN